MPAIYKRWLVVGFLMLNLLAPAFGLAQNSALVQQLRSQIADHNTQIAQLEKEIAQYEKSLNLTAAKADTLQNELTTLDTERKKLSTQIQLTQRKIAEANDNLSNLAHDIGTKDKAIGNLGAALAESLRKMRGLESQSLAEIVLSSGSLSNLVADEVRYSDLQSRVNEQIATFRELKSDLADRQAAVQAEKKKLLSLNSDLGDQKKLADSNRQEKNKLLTETKSSEVAYQKLLADRRAKKDAFEKELYDYESQLRVAIDPSLLPSRGSRPLAWPVDDVFITQLFGVTSDSGRLYASGSHNGVDFRASVGTPIKAAASGVVMGVGNTDAVCPGASYGKWVLIKHANGLSTVYGHLSLIKVLPDQVVSVGQVIGLSGNTGYTTGPHLHLGVFASQGVQIGQLKSKVCAGTYTMPIASTNAYLDPLVYLPAH